MSFQTGGESTGGGACKHVKHVGREREFGSPTGLPLGAPFAGFIPKQIRLFQLERIQNERQPTTSDSN